VTSLPGSGSERTNNTIASDLDLHTPRERIPRAQQLIRETKRSLIEIGLDSGYKNSSHFAQVFRRVVGVTPTEFRSGL
jgi:transcriptional regulator GlxA family with amidase domain